MNSGRKRVNYADYKERVIQCLANSRTWKQNGVWAHGSNRIEKGHILPLVNDKNTRENRAKAINCFLRFDCTPYFPHKLQGLHPYAYHLNSSQLLCLMFFSKLISKSTDDNRFCATKEMVGFIKNAFGIDIHEDADCTFEYVEKEEPYLFDIDKYGKIINGYEGTSFDFHIKDASIEIYFEIKFTEEGFKKEKGDIRHIAKAKKYMEIAPSFLKDKITTPEEFLNQYQIYRNVIRAKDNNKYVVFITDGDNPATNKDKEFINGLDLPKNIIFRTWQELMESKSYPYELPFQLKAIQ